MSTDRARIVVIGSTNTDMVVKVPRIPAPGETVLGSSFARVPGGKGANQALAAARLGASVTFVGCIGSDVFGRQSLQNLADEGVALSYCREDDATHSGVALIAVDDSGQNAIVVAPGANSRVTPEDVDRALPAIELAHVVVLQCEIPLETVRHAAEVARRLGKWVVLNPAPACQLGDDVLANVDVLTPNESEARALIGLTPSELPEDEAVARALLGRGVKLVVLTLGSRGALAATLQNGVPVLLRVAAFAVSAVDATAAGDCFTGALACAVAERLARGADPLHPQELEPSLRFATAAAALSVMKLGAQSSLPHRSDVEGFLASQA